VCEVSTDVVKLIAKTIRLVMRFHLFSARTYVSRSRVDRHHADMYRTFQRCVLCIQGYGSVKEPTEFGSRGGSSGGLGGGILKIDVSSLLRVDGRVGASGGSGGGASGGGSGGSVVIDAYRIEGSGSVEVMLMSQNRFC